jgi:acyl phosphate:glycerol-3-phosphate acyltransferase
MAYLIAVTAGYLLGSIPFGFLMGKWKGIDLRKAGSGNIGATNALRILGKPAGSAVLALDAFKGAFACWLVPFLATALVGDIGNGSTLAVIAGFSAVLGHNYTCWLRFKGGKGIATSAGVLLALTPGGLAISLSTFLILLGITRTVSIGSIGAAAILPFGTWLSGGQGGLLVITAVMGILAIYKHKGNIQRLLAGTEPRIGRKKTES